MKLCIVYNPLDSKLIKSAYCPVFKDMLYALIERFNCKCFVTGDCNAGQIDADIIFFFDPHASHHVEIKGIDKHPAVKMEYWNDMRQKEVKGVYQTTGIAVHKLGAEQRADRAKRRGTEYVVAGVRDQFHRLFSTYLNTEKMLLYFPHAPAKIIETSFAGRERAILGNGATWGGPGAYKFRNWAFSRPQIEHVKHYLQDTDTPKGDDFGDFIARYAGVLALTENGTVPKHFEVPAAGCVTFATHYQEYEDLGFKDMETCVYVDKTNFDERTKDFINHTEDYAKIADAGRSLMKENYTAGHFADFIYRKAEEFNEGC